MTFCWRLINKWDAKVGIFFLYGGGILLVWSKWNATNNNNCWYCVTLLLRSLCIGFSLREYIIFAVKNTQTKEIISFCFWSVICHIEWNEILHIHPLHRCTLSLLWAIFLEQLKWVLSMKVAAKLKRGRKKNKLRIN